MHIININHTYILHVYTRNQTNVRRQTAATIVLMIATCSFFSTYIQAHVHTQIAQTERSSQSRRYDSVALPIKESDRKKKMISQSIQGMHWRFLKQGAPGGAHVVKLDSLCLNCKLLTLGARLCLIEYGCIHTCIIEA
jgi:hypothetical protein